MPLVGLGTAVCSGLRWLIRLVYIMLMAILGKVPTRRVYLLSFSLMAIVSVSASVAFLHVYYYNQPSHSTSMLPENIRHQVGFTPYFYKNTLPSGYKLDPKQITYSQGVLSAHLTKIGEQDITVSQQLLPPQLKREDILSSGQKIELGFGEATLSSVEGRSLGSIVSNDTRPVLLFVSSSTDTNSDDIVRMIKALDKIK